MKGEGVVKEATGHSPLPWKLTKEDAGCAVCAKNGVDSYGIRDAKDQLVCVSEHDSFAPGRSDCEFIITAVNEHERLREALQQARQCITGHVCIINWSTTTREIQTREAQRIVGLIDAALNSEKGEGG